MKHKSGIKVLTPPAKPKEPFVRNVKCRGEIVELAFLSKAASMGFAVTKPYGDSEPYDFIVDSGNRLWRVQGRSGSYKTGSAYRINVSHLSNTKPKQKAYTAKQIDILAVYIVPLGVWYIIPIRAFTPSTSLAFLPDTPANYGTYARKYEQFREAWHLMACRRDGDPKDGIVTSPACTYSRLSGTGCAGCDQK
jgi:hypothetical protein